MKLFKNKLTAILALVTLTHINVWSLNEISPEEKLMIKEQFNYTPEVKLKQLQDSKRCRSGRLEFETTLNLSAESYNVTAKIYKPDNAHNEKQSVIFILPTIKGGQKLAGLLDRHTAISFCRRNFIAILIENDFTGLTNGTPLAIAESDLSVRRVVAALKGGIKISEDYLNIDKNKIGLFGASLGGILGVSAYGLMSEIKAGSFIVAGGNLPHILSQSNQKPIIAVKNKIMEQYELETEEQYEEFLSQYLKFDPIYFASFIDPQNIKLYMSLNDKAVPTEDQIQLFNELNYPENFSYYSRTGHALTIFSVLAFSRQKKHIADWFNERFATELISN